ncbi:chromosomal replication initiator protein DnaA [Variovorax sp. PCZ-1]|nr:chromosomal replication initiator protein DnaA [Variovorax sp. PCZ-1]
MTEGQVISSSVSFLETSADPAFGLDSPEASAIQLEAPQLWPRCLAVLAQELPEQQFVTWIKPLQAVVSPDLSKLTVLVANRFKLDWVRAQYAGKIAATAEKLCREAGGASIALELALAPRESQAKSSISSGPNSSFVAASSIVQGQNIGDFPPPGPALLTEDEGAGGFKSRINTALSFDTLVEGSANRMARAAALHVASNLGNLYNPLFIYGGVGLGKTHLLHAVGNQLLAAKPDAKVLYTHAEQFVSDVVRAYQRKTFDEFKARYHQLDLLLIDDVQFFANKDRTQEEFFNAFEALLAKKSHIVMTSDTYPKGLTDMHERLVSRFDSGLSVAIEPPELEMRVAILINKAISEGSSMPEDVAFFVAKNVRSNVRELEGALRKILAYSRFNQKEISIQLAREALRDLLSIQNRQIGVENIQKTVADFYKIKVADMYSKKRPASIARPRQIAMYLAKELTQKSLPEIGELFGGRDHTTVLHAVRKIGTERQQFSELNQQLHVLEQTLKG